MASREELEILLKWKQQNEQAAQDVAKKLDDIKKNTDALGGSMADTAKAGAAFGAGLSVGTAAMEALFKAGEAVLIFTRDAIQEWAKAGSELSDMALLTGLSTDALQEYAFAGKLVGLSAEAIATAVVKMSKTIAEGNAPVRQAIRDLNLDFAALRRERPEEQYRLISEAIRSIGDSGRQAAIANDIFGRSPEILKLIRSGAQDAAQEFHQLGLAMSEDSVRAADRLGDAGTKLDEIWKSIKRVFADTVVSGLDLVDMLELMVEVTGRAAATTKSSFGQSVIELEKEFLKFIPQVSGLVQNLEQLHFVLNLLRSDPAVKTPLFDPKSVLPGQIDVDALTKQQVKAAEEALKQIAEERKKAAEAAKKFAKEEFEAKAKAVADEERLVRAWAKDEADLDKQAAEHTKAMMKEEEDALLKAMKEEEDAAKDRFERRKEYEQQFTQIAEEAARRQHEANIRVTQDFGDLGRAIAAAGEAFGSGFLSNVGSAMDLFAQVSVQAQNATTGMQKATTAIDGLGAAFKSGSVLGGAGAGAAAGSMFGPWGAAIGGLIGGIAGLIGKHKQAVAEVNKLRDSFISSAGGMDALKQKAAEAGISLDALFAAKDSRKGLQAAIDQVKSGLDTWDQAHQQLQAAIDKYGFTVEELGPKFRAQELDKQAAQLFKEFELLKASGIDIVNINARMGPAFNEYVQTAISAGQAIPESMRGIIEGLIQQGQLLDENGQAYASVEDAGISFTQTMTEQFQTLIEKLDQFVSAIMGMPTSVPPIHVPVVPQRQGGGGEGGNAGGFLPGDQLPDLARGAVVLPFIPRAANGIVSATPGGTPVLVGEGGQSELVAPVRALADQIGAAAARAAMGAGSVIHVHVMLNQREIASAMVQANRAGNLPITPGSVRRA